MEELILLQDNPAPRGELLGLCQKTLLKQCVTDFKTLCDKQNCGPLELPDRARQITTTLNVLGQEWLIEARATAAAAQVPAASFMAITYPPEKVQPCLLPKRANDSTTAAVVTHDPSARAIFLENCDGPDIVHHVISRASSPGTLAYIALSEAADIGIKSFVNEAGLAGTFHIGQPVDDYTNTSMQPTLVLRQLCERATSCGQAVEEFQQIQKRLGPATPDKRGIVYLFADGAGDMLLLEATATRFQHRRISDGFMIAANKFQLGSPSQTSVEPFRQRCLREHLSATPPDVYRMLAGARIDKRAGSEKGVCDADTRASLVAVLGASGHPSYALVTLGSPLFNLPVPLFPRLGAPKGMVDGTAYTSAYRAPDPAREEKRAAYEKTLLQKLSTLGSGGSDEKHSAITNDLWTLSREYYKS